ncbi:50S ribosomal protein L30e-like protein, partial [Baffinella frigidus]
QECAASSLIKTGANEVTKSINRNLAEFIVIAADTVPIEMVLHLPMLCEDKGVPWVWLSKRTLIGNAVSKPSTTAAAVPPPLKADFCDEWGNIMLPHNTPATLSQKTSSKTRFFKSISLQICQLILCFNNKLTNL